MKYYAGIGSRQTPKSLIPTIDKIVLKLNELGYTLRSGAADGADKFFEDKADKTEIFLPWEGYNGHTSQLFNDTKEGWQLAEKYHPNWNALSDGAKKMMVRNGYQVLGFDLNTPVDFIVCWTRDGKASGGTGQALRIAKDKGITIFNLYYENAYKELYKHLNPFTLF